VPPSHSDRQRAPLLQSSPGQLPTALLVQTHSCAISGSSIASALRTVPESAEAARTQLREMRGTLHAAIDARCDDLEAGLSKAESTKIAALERELVAVDAALERWRSETRVVQEAVASLSDEELMSRHADLASRLDSLEAQLRALPTAPVEPPHVGLTMDTPALLASIASFGRIIAPLGITAADVTLEGVPSHVRPGQTLQLRLALGARHAEQSTEELEVSLGALAAASRCEVALCSGTATSAQIAALLIPSPTTRCVQVSIAVPPECLRGSTLTAQAFVFGHAVCVAPVVIPVVVGLCAPLLLSGVSSSGPCISTDGRLYVPSMIR